MAISLARSAQVWSEQLPVHRVQRTGLRLAATKEYDVWLLRWPPGSNVTPHDHGGSAGAFSVVSGEIEEIRWRGVVRRSRLVGPGEVVTIDRGVVHDVVAGSTLSVSVHVYSPPLAAMSFYDDSGQPVDHLAIEEGWVIDATPPPHPARVR
jgi:quercetin dioxygenase-like cupin family protein